MRLLSIIEHAIFLWVSGKAPSRISVWQTVRMFFSNGDFTCLGEFRTGIRCAKARGAECVLGGHYGTQVCSGERDVK